MITDTTPSPGKPGRPPKTSTQRLGEAAEAFLAALSALTDIERHTLNVDLNMRHDILLRDLERHHQGLIDVCRRAHRA